MDKYWFTDIPADQQWGAAHFPLPKCSGEDDTVLLWSADHTVQGLLQSVELDHKCFYYAANGKDLLNLQTYYPQYLELFAQLKSQFARRQGKKTVELKLGIYGRSSEQKNADNKKGGKEGAAKNKANATGAFFNPQIQSACGKKGIAVTNAQRWQCLVTGYISTPGPLASYQRKRGIDTKLRVKIN
jgi:hypothetical protein